ncbi:MAG: alpha/beta family hydrolase [bacterium]
MTDQTKETLIPFREDTLRIKVGSDQNKRFGLILGHGAGAGFDSPFMRYFFTRLSELGILVTQFNFRYKEAGRKAPPPRKPLESEYRAIIEYSLNNIYGDFPLFIGGKSMGGRIASYIAGEYPEVKGLVFLGYPLHPPGKPATDRAEHLYGLKKPMLFVSGSKDRLANLNLLKDMVAKLGKFGMLYLIEGADHSLQMPKKAAVTTEEVWNRSCEEIVNWVERC